MTLVIVAVMRPKWGQRADRVQHVGIDIVVLLDLSRSMSVEDVRPNRLKSAVGTISTLLERLPGGRVALVPFAGIAFVQCPLTGDYEVIRNYLGDLRITDISTQGTNLSQAIEVGLDVLGMKPKVTKLTGGAQETVHNYSGSKYKAMVLFTDGEHLGGDIEPALKRLTEANIPVFAVGVGTRQGDTIPEFDLSGNRVGVVQHPGKDGKKTPVFSELNEALLKDLSQSTSGTYFSLVQDGETVSVSDKLFEQLDRLEKKEYDEQMRKLQQDQFDWFLWIAFCLLILEKMIREQPRNLSRSRRTGNATSILVLVLLLIGINSSGCSTESDVFMKNNAAMQRALLALENGEIQRAVAFTNEAKSELPESPELNFNEGLVLQQVDEYGPNREAIRSLQRSLDRIGHKERSRVLYALARANARKALALERQEAAEEASAAVDSPAQPEGGEAAEKEASELRENSIDVWTRARELFVEVLKIDSDHVGARDGLETCLFRTNKPCRLRDTEHEPDARNAPRVLELKAPSYAAKEDGILCPRDVDYFAFSVPKGGRVWAKLSRGDVTLKVAGGPVSLDHGETAINGKIANEAATVSLEVHSKEPEQGEEGYSVETTVLPPCAVLDPEEVSDNEAGMGPIVQGLKNDPLRICPGDVDHRTIVLLEGDSLIVELSLSESQGGGGQPGGGQNQGPRLGPKVPEQSSEAIPDVLVLNGDGEVVAQGIKSKDRVMAVAEKPGEGVFFVRIAAPKEHPQMERPYLLSVIRVPDCPDGNVDDLVLRSQNKESNDLPDQATALQAGSVGLGRICRDDLDWYTLQADEEKETQVVVWFNRSQVNLKVDGYLTEDLDAAPVLSKATPTGAVFVVPPQAEASAPRVRIRGAGKVDSTGKPEGFYWIQHVAQSPGNQNDQNQDSKDKDQEKKDEDQQQDEPGKDEQQQAGRQPQSQQALEQLLQEMDRNPRNLEADQAAKKAKGAIMGSEGGNW
jgi:Ca-activated chloride channel family protein